MADQKELDELKQRIALLRWDTQLHLFELVFASLRNAQITDENQARQELAALEAWHLQQRSSDQAEQA